MRTLQERIDATNTRKRPLHPSRTCMICGQYKHPKHKICQECSEEFGHDQREWEPWVRFMVNDRRRKDRREEKTPTLDYDPDELDDDASERWYEEHNFDFRDEPPDEFQDPSGRF